MKYRPFALIFTLFALSPALTAYARGSEAIECLYKVTALSAERSHEANLEIIREINSIPPPIAKSERVLTVKKQTAVEVNDMIESHPITEMGNKTYDPEGNLGFCFGRATAAHLELLARGVHRDSIRKVWVVGSMKTDDMMWRYHVATMVRAAPETKAGWWVIDPFADEVLSLADWYAYMKKSDAKGDLRLYVTDAKRWSANSSLPYTREELSNPDYNGYFEDFLASLQVGRLPHGGISGKSLIPGGATPSDPEALLPTPEEEEAAPSTLFRRVKSLIFKSN